MTPNYGSSQGFETWQQVEEKKRFYFKKNSNRVAKTMLLSLLLQFVLMFLFEFVYLFFRAFSEAMQYVAATGETSFQAIYQIVLNTDAHRPDFLHGALLCSDCSDYVFQQYDSCMAPLKGSGIRLKGLFQGVRPTAGFVGLSIVFLFGLNFVGGIIYQLINAGRGLVGFRAPGSSLSFPTDFCIGRGVLCAVLLRYRSDYRRIDVPRRYSAVVEPIQSLFCFYGYLYFVWNHAWQFC